MKTINLSKKRFNSLKPLHNNNKVISTESIIYNYRYNKDYDGIIKKLYRIDAGVFGNKLYTIEMLNYYKRLLPNSFVIPDNIVTVSNELIGFTMPKITGDNLGLILKSDNIDYKDKIYYLKEIGNILDKLDNIRKYTELKDIFIGDLQEYNFLVNPYSKDLYVVDLDSCKINNNIPSPSKYLTKNNLITNSLHKYKVNNINNFNYINAYIIPDSNSDLYCYNIMVLNYLYGANINNISLLEYYNYLNYLEYIGLDKELLTIFNNLITSENNYNIAPYLDTITKENIIRSNNKVYRKVKINNF